MLSGDSAARLATIRFGTPCGRPKSCETVEKLAESGEIWVGTAFVQNSPCGFSALP
jgi:hypothetical protein